MSTYPIKFETLRLPLHSP